MSCYIPDCKNEAVNRCCGSDHFMCEEHTSIRACGETGAAVCENCAAEGHRHRRELSEAS